MSIEDQLRQTARSVDAALRALTSGAPGPSSRLVEAARYCLGGGGKRIRPVLTIWCCELCGGDRASAMPAATAVECVHTFGLVHDDLPALDDDDVRRGRATCHRKYDEPTAVLAGDALLALAFETLAAQPLPADVTVAMVRELADAAGPRGMIGGEAADIETQTSAPDERIVAEVHYAKTARLFEAACRLGAMAARADEGPREAVARYGRELGLAFQATDDLLDATGDAGVVGKRTGKDAAAGKQTYLRVVGIEATRERARELAEAAVRALDGFDPAATTELRALARYVVERRA